MRVFITEDAFFRLWSLVVVDGLAAAIAAGFYTEVEFSHPNDDLKYFVDREAGDIRSHTGRVKVDRVNA